MPRAPSPCDGNIDATGGVGRDGGAGELRYAAGGAACRRLPCPSTELISLDGVWEVTAVGGEGTGGKRGCLITFERAGFRANLGCNEMRAGYIVRANQLLSTGGFSTERGCFDPRPGAPDPMRFEERGFRILRRPMDMQMVEGLLSLSNRAGSLTLKRLP